MLEKLKKQLLELNTDQIEMLKTHLYSPDVNLTKPFYDQYRVGKDQKIDMDQKKEVELARLKSVAIKMSDLNLSKTEDKPNRRSDLSSDEEGNVSEDNILNIFWFLNKVVSWNDMEQYFGKGASENEL